MDFTLRPDLADLRDRVRVFMDTHVLPAEAAVVAEDARGAHGTLHDLQALARQSGLWVPHLPVAIGGLGLGVMGMCVLFREMGRSPVGARVFNCDAPDQGNMELLVRSASAAQRARWLLPLAEGRITSGFAMTEPAPGAGADPTNLRTMATRAADGASYRIDGHKWFTTGGGAAAFFIVLARTSPDPRRGATMFLVDRRSPGITHVRDVPTMGGALLAHREAELRFDGVQVSVDDRLGEEGEGFTLAQARLVPARLTHCMRWLGLADRTLALCRAYVTARRSFGKTLSEHQLVQAMIARSATAIHAGNLMTFHAAWLLEQGRESEARTFSSMAKTHVANLLCQTLDDAIQMHGALGYSEDLPFSTWYRHARAARIADGPDEVHVGVIARDVLAERVALLG